MTERTDNGWVTVPRNSQMSRDTVRPEWEDQRIRIEALRAAAQVTSALSASTQTINHTPLVLPEATLHFAEQFARWLETGER